MAREYRIISADSHVNPLPTIYADYLPAKYKDRAPRVEQRGEEEVALFEGQEWHLSHTSASAGLTPAEFKRLQRTFTAGHRGGWDVHARIADQDADGVDAEVLFGAPHGGGSVLATDDRAFRFALMQAYNDWLADFCTAYPDRLVGIGEIPHWDLDLAIGEARRLRARGLRGVLLPAIPTRWDPSDHPYTDPWYEPLWSALEELQLPIHLHLGVKPLTPGLDTGPLATILSIACTKPMMAEPIGSLLFSGALERHPKLKVVGVECGVGWMAHFVTWIDYTFEREQAAAKAPPLKERPSFYFHRQVKGTYIYDPVGIRERHTIGLDCIMWSNDYPHNQSSWPHSRRMIEEQFAGVPEAEKRRIICDNARELYGL